MRNVFTVADMNQHSIHLQMFLDEDKDAAIVYQSAISFWMKMEWENKTNISITSSSWNNGGSW